MHKYCLPSKLLCGLCHSADELLFTLVLSCQSVGEKNDCIFSVRAKEEKSELISFAAILGKNRAITGLRGSAMQITWFKKTQGVHISFEIHACVCRDELLDASCEAI